MRKALLVVPIIMMMGCQSDSVKVAHSMTKLSVGMTEVEVSKLMKFSPNYVSQSGNAKIARYSQYDYNGSPMTPLYVRYVNGVVESFGILGDFDSTKDPTSRVIIDKTDNIKTDSVSKFDLATELAKLDKLKKDGLITAEDYELLKKRAIEKAKE